MGATVFTTGMAVEVMGYVSIRQEPYVLRLTGNDGDGLARRVIETRQQFIDRKRKEAGELAGFGAVVMFHFYDNDNEFGCTMMVGNCAS